MLTCSKNLNSIYLQFFMISGGICHNDTKPCMVLWQERHVVYVMYFITLFLTLIQRRHFIYGPNTLLGVL